MINRSNMLVFENSVGSTTINMSVRLSIAFSYGKVNINRFIFSVILQFTKNVM